MSSLSDLQSVANFTPGNLLSIGWWTAFVTESYSQNPIHVWIHLGLLLVIVYLLLRRPYRPGKVDKLSRHEEDDLIAAWRPEPLVPGQKQECKEFPVVSSASHAELVVDGQRVVNFAANNFLGLADEDELKAAGVEAIEHYGVGSCGPRGFYGSIDVHMDFEKAISKFLDVEETVLYSDSIGCVSSVIPAFAKAGDLIVCDEAVHWGIQQGLSVSRSNIIYFKHNDVRDLERVLQEMQERDRNKQNKGRRFIVVEGIYRNWGDMAPLLDIVKLKFQYKYRLIVDDTYGFGVLGPRGRGTWEHFGLQVSDIDILCGGLDAACATVGGFSTGSKKVADHQRLSGNGYCFSASAPPFTSAAGIAAIRLMEQRPQYRDVLAQRCKEMRRGLRQIGGVIVSGDEASPISHLRLDANTSRSAAEDKRLLQSIAEECQRAGVWVSVPDYIPSERVTPTPSIKVLVTREHSPAQIAQCVNLLQQSFKSRLQQRR